MIFSLMLFFAFIGFHSSASEDTSSIRCEELRDFRCRAGLSQRNEGTSASLLDLRSQQDRIIKDVRTGMIQWIERQNLNSIQREAMIQRVRNLEVSVDLSETARGEAGYDYGSHKLSLTRSSITGFSEFSFVRTLAHEMAHSLDPCNLQRPVGVAEVSRGKGLAPRRLGPPKSAAIVTLSEDTLRNEVDAFQSLPFSHVHRCLSREQNLGLPQLAETLTRIRQHWNLPAGVQAEEDYLADRYPTCLYTRHLESFCDFLATEVLVSYLQLNRRQLSPAQTRNGLANIATASCDGDDPARIQTVSAGNHPTSNERLNKILLAHPILRTMTGCSNNHEYCGSNPEMKNKNPHPVDVGI